MYPSLTPHLRPGVKCAALVIMAMVLSFIQSETVRGLLHKQGEDVRQSLPKPVPG